MVPSWPPWSQLSFLTWNPQRPAWGTVDIQKSNTKMLCIYCPKGEPMAFIRFSKGYLTHQIFWTTVAIRKGLMLSMILSLHFHWMVIWLYNEIVAHTAKAEIKEGWGVQSITPKGWSQVVLGWMEAPAAFLKQPRILAPSSSLCSYPSHFPVYQQEWTSGSQETWRRDPGLQT